MLLKWLFYVGLMPERFCLSVLQERSTERKRVGLESKRIKGLDMCGYERVITEIRVTWPRRGGGFVRRWRWVGGCVGGGMRMCEGSFSCPMHTPAFREFEILTYAKCQCKDRKIWSLLFFLIEAFSIPNLANCLMRSPIFLWVLHSLPDGRWNALHSVCVQLERPSVEPSWRCGLWCLEGIALS